MTRARNILFVCIFFLYGCVKQTQAIPPTWTVPRATETSAPPTETATLPPTDTPVPVATIDPILFGSIGQGEIQAFSLEPVANAIFTKTMDGFISDGIVIEYQVLRVTIFPGNGGLLAEITFNVRSTHAMWLEDGGTQATDNWINDKCNRFDFVTTETEFQLKNRRMCN